MNKDNLDLEMLENADEETVKRISEEYRALTEEDTAKLYKRSEELYRERMGGYEAEESGVEIYRRPVWHKITAVAASLVLIAAGAGLGGMTIMNHLRSQQPAPSTDEVTATTDVTEPQEETSPPSAEPAEQVSSQLDDIVIDTIRFMDPAYFDWIITSADVTAEMLAGEINFSAWQETAVDSSYTESDYIELFIYNNGDPQDFIFYYDGCAADHIIGDTVVRYTIPMETKRAVLEAVIRSDEEGERILYSYDKAITAGISENYEPMPEKLLEPMPVPAELEGRNIIDLDYSATADYSYDINSLPELGRHSCNVITGTVEGYSFRENQTSSSYTGETVLKITVTGDAMNELEPGTQTELVLPGGYRSMRQHYGDTLYAEGGKYGDGIDMTEEEIDNTYYRYIFDNGEVPIVGKEYAFFVYDNGSGYGITGNNDSMLYKYDGVYIHKQDSGVLYLTMEDLKHMVKQGKDETAE